MSLLSAIKQSLRISADNSDFDEEINDLISQAIDDLKASGIKPDVFNNYGKTNDSGDVIDSITDGNMSKLILA